MTSKYSMEELIEVVAWLTRRYTSNESSSVTYELANQLMEAVLYCIDADDRECQTDETVPAALSEKSAKEAYLSGYDKILMRVKEANKQYNQIITSFDDYGNDAYYDTVVKGLPAFFNNYDIWFCPQDAILTFDYPTIIPVYQKQGIDAIESFISCVALEQKFLKKIPRQQVIDILKTYHKRYEFLFINIASMIMRYLVATVLNITAIDKEAVEKHQIEECLKKLIEDYYDGDMALYEYLKADINDFAVEKTFFK